MAEAVEIEVPETSESRAIALPRTVQDLLNQRKTKQKTTLNDQVEAIHLSLYEDSEYQRFLDAVHSSQAVEGDLFCDDIEACRIVRKYARENGNPYVATQNLATLRKALHVVLRRYGIDRKSRRDT